MIENLVFFIISCIFLIASASILVKSLKKISDILKIPEFTAAFIIMALATSLPELFVGISSGLSGNPEISLGNLIGAGLLNMTLITGIFVIYAKKIQLNKNQIKKESRMLISTILFLMILFLIDKELSKIDGILLLSVFSINIYKIYKNATKRDKKQNKETKRDKKEFIIFITFILGLVFLFISSNYAVKYASLVAIDLKLPKMIIGLFLMSIATTLPELIFGLSAIKQGHKEMAIGDQIGTAFLNITFVLGIVALIHPIKADVSSFIISSTFFLIGTLLFTKIIQSKGKLEKKDGILLIIYYSLFPLMEILKEYVMF